MRVDGSCHCGFVTFTADADAETAGVCHCTDCQAISGSAFRTTVRAVPGTFALTSGTPTLYIKTTAESGTHREHAFCPRCGTSIYASSVGAEPRMYSLRFGTLKQKAAIAPRRQIWTRSRVPWLAGLTGVQGFDKGA
ncbi:MAG TPA: GFA family protein [Polyangiaceae bacterium]|jgi:hypothetical protein